MAHEEAQPNYRVKREGLEAVVVLEGAWTQRRTPPEASGLSGDLGDARRARFRADGLERWDTALVLWLCEAAGRLEADGVAVDSSELPDGIRRLAALAGDACGREPPPPPPGPGLLRRVGRGAFAVVRGVAGHFDFFGRLVLSALRFARGRARFRRKELAAIFQGAGPEAAPIVCLLSFLTGLIIAFIGVIQLQKLAADLYVADLVGLAMTRELGAVMTGVIMAGRTGAAFAAQLGSMRVNEETDALTVFGISPFEFLVLPRLAAMLVMVPLLTVFADAVGIVGGAAVTVAISGIGLDQYFHQMREVVSLTDIGVGIFKSFVFGGVIALAGCHRGLHCGRDAASVGHAATSAVVMAITWIVVFDAVFAVIFHILGI